MSSTPCIETLCPQPSILSKDTYIVVLTHRQNAPVISMSPVTIKLADFGLAKVLEGEYHTNNGTRIWTAPEKQSGIYGEKVDMWSVGCVVFYLLTSLDPFSDQDDVNNKNPNRRYPFPSAIRKFIFPF